MQRLSCLQKAATCAPIVRRGQLSIPTIIRDKRCAVAAADGGDADPSTARLPVVTVWPHAGHSSPSPGPDDYFEKQGDGHAAVPKRGAQNINDGREVHPAARRGIPRSERLLQVQCPGRGNG